MSYLGTTKIGKMYLGSTEIAKAYLGNDLVFQKGGGTTLIPYIRNSVGSGNASYIDTGITPDNTTRVIIWARNWNPNSGFLFGSRVASNDNMFALYANTGAQSGSIGISYNSGLTSMGDCFRYLSGYHKYELNNNALYIDDVLVGSATSANFSNVHNIHLFGINNGGTHSNNTYPIDICKAEIWKNGSLVRYFTPVESPSIGFYDSVSQTVFTNQGPGSFTYGSFDKNAYEPLEYIEADGNQYFDSGIHGTQALPFVFKYRPNVGTGYPQLFGARTSSSSKRYELSLGNNTTAAKVLTSAYNTGTQSYDNGSSMNGNIYVAVKGTNVVTLYLQGNSYPMTSKSTLTHTAATFETDYNIYVGALNNAGSAVNKFTGKYYFLGFGSSRNFVPAKVNGVAGMYDTYNDQFYPSATDTPFIAGPSLAA